MKLFFVVLFCAVVGVFSEAEEKEECMSINTYDKNYWPSPANSYVFDANFKNISDYDHNKLSNLVNENQDGMIITHFRVPLEIQYKTHCTSQYRGYLSRTFRDYPNVKFYYFICPSQVCEELNSTSTITLDYYFKGEHKGQLVQGLDEKEYLQKLKEVFGEITGDMCIPMKRYEEYNWQGPINYTTAPRFSAVDVFGPTREYHPYFFLSSFREVLRNQYHLRKVSDTNDDMLIFLSDAALHRRQSEECMEKYKMYFIQIYLEHQHVKFYQAYCPSPVCEALNATSGISFHFYSRGQHKGQLGPGLDASEYYQKAREMFGETKSCIPLTGNEAYNWPTDRDNLSKQMELLKPLTKKLEMDELNNLRSASEEDALIFESHSNNDRLVIKGCQEKYEGYFLQMIQDYPQVKFYEANCPSPVCEALNATSGISFDYFSKGQHKGQLVQGLDAKAYVEKARELFGVPVANEIK